MATLIERAQAYLDAAQPEMGKTSEVQAINWLDADSREARGLKAAYVIDVSNSVILDDMRKVACEAQDAVIATVQAYIRDGDMETVIRKLAETHNVHVEGWSHRYPATA